MDNRINNKNHLTDKGEVSGMRPGSEVSQAEFKVAVKPETKPVAEQPASSADADALWKQVLARVQRVNAFVRQLAAYGQATALTEDQLTVTFPAEYAGKLKMLNTRSVAVIQGELDALRPGVRLLLREGTDDDGVADLVGLFKDKLTIT